MANENLNPCPGCGRATRGSIDIIVDSRRRAWCGPCAGQMLGKLEPLRVGKTDPTLARQAAEAVAKGWRGDGEEK